MMIKTLEQAHAALADALWWFKGFSAASPSPEEPRGMADDLREARLFLDRITDGKVRRLGDEKAVVITYAEFDRLLDAFPTSGQPAPAEVGHARETLRTILAEYSHEALAARDLPEVPF